MIARRLLPQGRPRQAARQGRWPRGVESLDDRFSHYFDPKRVQGVRGGDRRRVRGRRHDRRRGRARAARRDRVRRARPPQRGGIETGDVIIAVDGRSLAGQDVRAGDDADQGPGGHRGHAAVVDGKKPPRGRQARSARGSTCRWSSPRCRRRPAAARSATSGSPASPPARTARSARRSTSCWARAPRASCSTCATTAAASLNEAVLISSIFIPDGHDRLDRTAARGPKRIFEATGDAIDTKIPVVVLVNSETASASEIVTGALQDRDRAEVVGDATFGKGVFQEVEQLSNGGALDITVGEYFTPERPQPRRRRRQAGRRASSPTSRRERRPEDQSATRRSTRRGRRRRAPTTRRRREPRRPGRRGAREARALPDRRAVLRPRPAHQRRPSRSAAQRAASATSCSWRRAARAAGTARWSARLGRPDVARDVIEALMLDRGLRRRFDPVVERAARERRRRACRRDVRAPRPARPADVHDRPADARDFDDAICAERLDDGAVACGSTSPTSPPTCAPGSAVDREAYRRAHSVYVPGRSSRCCPRRCPTTPARSCRTRTGSRSPSSSTSTARRSSGPRSTAR